ncbi:M48 family metallopeptidase [Candidatus Calescamantes bacterium]|nr:M48 family metallopeptidase [Candidatus Calescamantes bacterium]
MRKVFKILFFSLIPFFFSAFPEREFLLGLKLSAKIEEKINVSEEKNLVRRVNMIGVKIASSIPSSYPLTFSILELEEANAIAIPGGFIYLTKGLFDLNPTDDEIAFVIGHEIAHLEKKHLYKIKKIQTLLNLLLFTLSYPIIRESDNPEAACKLLELSSLLLERKYSREQEEEADYWGRIYALKSGYQDAAKSFFQKLDFWKEEKPEKVYLLYASHPFIEERVKKAKHTLGMGSASPSPVKEKEWLEKVQSFLWEMSKKAKGKEKDILLRNLYNLSPFTSLGGEACYLLLKRKFLKWEKEKNYYPAIKEARKLLQTYPHLKEREELIKKLKRWETKYCTEKRKWEERLDKNNPSSFYQNFLTLFPDSERRKEAWEKLIQIYLKENLASCALECLLKLKKEFPQVSIKEKGLKLIGRIEKLDLLQEFYSYYPEEKVKERLIKLISKEESLKILAKLREIKNEEIEREARERIEMLACKKFKEAKVKELSGDIESSRKIKREILEYAGWTEEAKRIREEIKRKEIIRAHF